MFGYGSKLSKIMTLHVVTKVFKLLLRAKILATMLKLAIFAIKCVDMVLNDQGNYLTCCK